MCLRVGKNSRNEIRKSPNHSVSSSRLLTDTRQQTCEKLDESLTGSVKKVIRTIPDQDSHKKTLRGTQSSSRKPSTKINDIRDFSGAKSEKNGEFLYEKNTSKIKGNNDSSFLLQNVYSVKNKHLSFSTLMSRPRNNQTLGLRESPAGKASEGVKNSEIRHLRQSMETLEPEKVNLSKRLSEPSVKTKDIGVRKKSPNVGARRTNQMSEVEKSVPNKKRDQSEERRSNEYMEIMRNMLKERLEVFMGTIEIIVDKAAFREKRSFFIKLLENLHNHKMKLSNVKSFFIPYNNDSFYPCKNSNRKRCVFTYGKVLQRRENNKRSQNWRLSTNLKNRSLNPL